MSENKIVVTLDTDKHRILWQYLKGFNNSDIAAGRKKLGDIFEEISELSAKFLLLSEFEAGADVPPAVMAQLNSLVKLCNQAYHDGMLARYIPIFGGSPLANALTNVANKILKGFDNVLFVPFRTREGYEEFIALVEEIDYEKESKEDAHTRIWNWLTVNVYRDRR